MRETVGIDGAPTLDHPLGVIDAQAPAPDEALAPGETADRLRAAIGRLPEREATILRLRFGLDGGPAQTLDQVGAALGVTRERVRQLEGRALARLRGLLKGER